MLYGEHFIYGRHRALLQAKCPQARVEIVPGGRFCMSWERATDCRGTGTSFFALKATLRSPQWTVVFDLSYSLRRARMSFPNER